MTDSSSSALEAGQSIQHVDSLYAQHEAHIKMARHLSRKAVPFTHVEILYRAKNFAYLSQFIIEYKYPDLALGQTIWPPIITLE